jgi:hypothetical protein
MGAFMLFIALEKPETCLLPPLNNVFAGVFKIYIPDVGINAGSGQILATPGPSTSIAPFFFLFLSELVI